VAPSIFIFDKDRKLRYSGRIDSDPRTGRRPPTTLRIPWTKCLPTRQSQWHRPRQLDATSS
jgi:hypothetical protein